MTNLLPTLKIEIGSAPESVAMIRATILKVAAGCGLQDNLTDDLITAVSEACNNVVLHAYPASPGRLVVSVEVSELSVDAEVRDFGRGARTLVSSGSGLGMGVALIHSMSSRAQFESRPGAGMTVRMSFDRPVEAGQEALKAGATSASPHAIERQTQRRPFGNARRVTQGSVPGSA